MEIMLIRHSMTAGNLQRRYVGRTDEGLCPEGIELAEQKAQFLLMPDIVYTSPMLRCRETAEIYRLPLTVRILLPAGKTAASLNGSALVTEEAEGLTYAYLNLIPGSEVTLDLQ